MVIERRITSKASIIRVIGEVIKHDEDIIVREVGITIFLNGQEYVTTVCSPYSFDVLVAGFLLVEGIITKKEDLLEINYLEEKGQVWVETKHPVYAKDPFRKRYLASSGERGRFASHFIGESGLGTIDTNVKVSISQIYALNKRREALGTVFRKTGGTHGVALCNPNEVLFFYEDIGRHNALDKVLGRALLEDVGISDKIIFLSGRISSEMVFKVARAGVPMIFSKSAPTNLALDMAESLNITVVGFVRQNCLNIYTHPERIYGDKSF